MGALFVYAVQRLQAWLPLNPQAFRGQDTKRNFTHAKPLNAHH
jgi:K+-transporting ATPase ATPase A chain